MTEWNIIPPLFGDSVTLIQGVDGHRTLLVYEHPCEGDDLRALQDLSAREARERIALIFTNKSKPWNNSWLTEDDVRRLQFQANVLHRHPKTDYVFPLPDCYCGKALNLAGPGTTRDVVCDAGHGLKKVPRGRGFDFEAVKPNPDGTTDCVPWISAKDLE